MFKTEQLILGIFSCLLIGTGVFFSVDTILLSAKVTLPYSSDDAGLYFEVQENNITEAAHDEGTDQITKTLTTVFSTLKIVFASLATVWLIYAGVIIISSGTDEEKISSAKRKSIYTILALFGFLLAEPLVLDVFYGGRDISIDGQGISDPETAAKNFRDQMQAVLEWLKAILVFISMAYVILAGVRMIFAFGGEEEISAGKKMIIPIALGLLVIAFNEFLIDRVIYDIIFDGQKVEFSPDAENARAFIEQLVAFIQYLLTFVAIIAFVMMIYAGVLYIFAFGDEEKGESGKKIFKNAVIGIIVILISYAFTYSLVTFDFFN